jgi:hypothetical protein
MAGTYRLLSPTELIRRILSDPIPADPDSPVEERRLAVGNQSGDTGTDHKTAKTDQKLLL